MKNKSRITSLYLTNNAMERKGKGGGEGEKGKMEKGLAGRRGRNWLKSQGQLNTDIWMMYVLQVLNHNIQNSSCHRNLY